MYSLALLWLYPLYHQFHLSLSQLWCLGVTERMFTLFLCIHYIYNARNCNSSAVESGCWTWARITLVVIYELSRCFSYSMFTVLYCIAFRPGVSLKQNRLVFYVHVFSLSLLFSLCLCLFGNAVVSNDCKLWRDWVSVWFGKHLLPYPTGMSG